ncbi:MAG: lipopolysaccharide core heptose(I) kinase RfaP [Methylophaga sp.]
MTKRVYVREDLQALCGGKDVFAVARELDGEVFRDKEGRRTLRFSYDGKSYFLKYHAGIGWREIIKNLLQGRLPVVSARNEWQAVQALEKAGIDTMTLAAFGERGLNPARRESFVITEDLTQTMSLEYVGEQWQKTPPTLQSKRLLIEKLATISRKMHTAGINHRDYYLCHFLLDEAFAEHNVISDSTRLFLIDLHRAQIRRAVPRRWQVKDLASLHFSAHAVQLSQRDLLRFIRTYTGVSLHYTLHRNKYLWAEVSKRSNDLLLKWQKHHG